MIEYAKAKGLKGCPKCKGWVEKVSGCQYIDCKCGAFWCFDCAALFDPDTKKCTKCGYAHTFNAINNTAKDKKKCPKCQKDVHKN
jgi:predicted Zn-ribbon and HTH transcriptional regulator